MNFVSRDFTERQIDRGRVRCGVHARPDKMRHADGTLRLLHNRCAPRDAEGVHEPISVPF